jgi:hypothetical protein
MLLIWSFPFVNFSLKKMNLMSSVHLLHLQIFFLSVEEREMESQRIFGFWSFSLFVLSAFLHHD